MLYKICFAIFFCCFGTSLYSQPTNYCDSWEFKIKDVCNSIIFNFHNSDTVFVDKKNQYQLKILQCGSQCYPVIGEKLRLQSGMIVELSGVIQIPIIIIELTRISDDKKMIVEFFNYQESSFSTEFKFRKGKYKIDVNNLLAESKANRKKGFNYYFIRQKYFEKEN